jgi:hypothetical protein
MPMRFADSIIVAGSLFVSWPAIAQDNATAPANVAVASPAVQNSATATPSIVGGPIDQNAVRPAAAPDQVTIPPPEHHGFPFGVIGLIGLLGLLGVRKVKS